MDHMVQVDYVLFRGFSITAYSIHDSLEYSHVDNHARNILQLCIQFMVFNVTY